MKQPYVFLDFTVKITTIVLLTCIDILQMPNKIISICRLCLLIIILLPAVLFLADDRLSLESIKWPVSMWTAMELRKRTGPMIAMGPLAFWSRIWMFIILWFHKKCLILLQTVCPKFIWKNHSTMEVGGRLLVDIRGKFLWTKWVNSCGHFW